MFSTETVDANASVGIAIATAMAAAPKETLRVERTNCVASIETLPWMTGAMVSAMARCGVSAKEPKRLPGPHSRG